MIIDTSNWGWPQFTYLALFFVSVFCAGLLHGEDRIVRTGRLKGKPQKHDVLIKSVGSMFVLFILIAGGFFG